MHSAQNHVEVLAKGQIQDKERQGWEKGKWKREKSQSQLALQIFFFFNLGEIQSLETFFHSFANGCIVTA